MISDPLPPQSASLPEQLRQPFAAPIVAEISRAGEITFRDYMQLALYHPDCGYYAAARAQIGRRGDFFTNVSVGALFGEMLAGQFREMWEILGRPGRFTVVEQGAAAGDFARDVLNRARFTTPEFFEALEYVIIEPFAPWRRRQEERLRESGGSIRWLSSLAELPPFTGVHFSNELLDAFPVHLVRYARGEWEERWVSPDLKWRHRPITSGALRERLNAINPPKIEGYTTEISLDALAWLDELAARLARGWVLAIDYGYARDVYYSPERASGTLACCENHRRTFDPLVRPGELDITAHVDFTSLAERAQARGLELAGFTDQHHFMVGLAKSFFAQRPPGPKEARALQTLVHPQFLGTTFKVLGLRTPGGTESPLRGFEFAADAAGALGLGRM